MGCPPYTGSTRTPSTLPYRCTASATCIASSRVGTSTTASGPPEARPARIDEALQDGQGEGRGLARSRGGLAEQVAALDQRRDRLLLDRRGLFVAQRGESLDDAPIEPQRGKAFVLQCLLGHPAFYGARARYH
jgi:hypothetical protein